MKLLFDQYLSLMLCARLKDIFSHESQVGLLGLDRADDDEILQYVFQNEFTLVTKDGDFSDLSILRGAPSKIIDCSEEPTNDDHRKHNSKSPQRYPSICSR